MTNARDGSFAAVLYNNNIYVFGGWPAESSVEAYDIAAEKWTSKASPPSGAQQYDQAAVVYRDLIWQCGGWNGPGTACFSYNPRSDVWTSAASMTTARCDFGLVVLGDSIYAIGGHSSPKTAERYNPSTNAWEPLPGQLTNYAYEAVILPIGV